MNSQTVTTAVKDNSEKLERFTAAVNGEIDTQVDAMLDEANDIKQEIINTAISEAEIFTEQAVESGKKVIANKYVKMVAKEELDSKKEILLERETLIKAMFDEIKEKIVKFKSGKDYLGFLVNSLKSEKLGDDVVVKLSAEDLKFSDEISKALNKKISFSEDASIKLGGLSILCENNGTIIDKTFDLAVSDARAAFNEKNCFSIMS
ncbi:MAG: V-type ATP synthase subunit E family protein [Oscillospiraceae bacterium]